VHADMMRLTLEIVGQTLFSADVAGQADRVGRAMEAVMNYFASLPAMVPWLARLPTPTNLRFRSAVQDLSAIVYDTITQRRAGGTGGEDLLSRLLAARDEDGSAMTDRQLRDEVVTLLLAGHETTALALSFCFYLLALHPEVEARLATEVDAVLEGRAAASAD